jgi:voltage-gated sodium channel
MKKIQDWLCNERLMLFCIVANTVIMFFGGFWPDCMLLSLCDAMFTIIFLFEALAKISRYGWHRYWGRRLNRFDLIVLIIALPSLASLFVEQSMAMNTILALRSLRLFKSFKMLHFIPNIHKLLNGLKLAFRASLLIFLAFIIFLVIFSILSSTLFERIDPEHFGNPALSVYSIFRLFTIEGWYDMPEAIAANSGAAMAVFARIYFSILLFLGGIIGMSLVNSIFVDAMAADNNDEVLEKLSQLERKLDSMKREQDNKVQP